MAEPSPASATGKTIKEALAKLACPESTFYKYKSLGTAQVTRTVENNEISVRVSLGVVVERDNAPSPGDHLGYLERWIAWRDSGLGQRIWSDNYRTHQIQYARRFFRTYRALSFANAKAFIEEVPPTSVSARKDRYKVLCSVARFLETEEQLSPTELQKIITQLKPCRSPHYQPLQRPIYPEHLEVILRATRHCPLLEVLTILLSETALRASELCNLQRQHLQFSMTDPTRAFIQVHRGKGNKNRLVPFSRKAQEAMQKYLASSLGEPFFWTVTHRKSGIQTKLTRDWLAREFKKLSDTLRIPFSCHSFRHYRITQWANNPRIPITVTQKWAGHASLEVTQRYIHIRDEDAMRAAFE